MRYILLFTSCSVPVRCVNCGERKREMEWNERRERDGWPMSELTTATHRSVPNSWWSSAWCDMIIFFLIIIIIVVLIIFISKKQVIHKGSCLVAIPAESSSLWLWPSSQSKHRPVYVSIYLCVILSLSLFSLFNAEEQTLLTLFRNKPGPFAWLGLFAGRGAQMDG